MDELASRILSRYSRSPGLIQRKGEGDSSVGPGFGSLITRSQGQPLPGPVRSRMEASFGQDLSGVRVHTDASAAQAAQAIQARAFTTGQDIYFAPGEWRPGTQGGQELIAHELTHTIQQRYGVVDSGRVSRSPRNRLARWARRGVAGLSLIGALGLHSLSGGPDPIPPVPSSGGPSSVQVSQVQTFLNSSQVQEIDRSLENHLSSAAVSIEVPIHGMPALDMGDGYRLEIEEGTKLRVTVGAKMNESPYLLLRPSKPIQIIGKGVLPNAEVRYLQLGEGGEVYARADWDNALDWNIMPDGIQDYPREELEGQLESFVDSSPALQAFFQGEEGEMVNLPALQKLIQSLGSSGSLETGDSQESRFLELLFHKISNTDRFGMSVSGSMAYEHRHETNAGPLVLPQGTNVSADAEFVGGFDNPRLTEEGIRLGFGREGMELDASNLAVIKFRAIQISNTGELSFNVDHYTLADAAIGLFALLDGQAPPRERLLDKRMEEELGPDGKTTVKLERMLRESLSSSDSPIHFLAPYFDPSILGQGGPVQRKPMHIGAAGDRYEREADRVASRFTRGQPIGPIARGAAGTVQRATEVGWGEKITGNERKTFFGGKTNQEIDRLNELYTGFFGQPVSVAEFEAIFNPPNDSSIEAQVNTNLNPAGDTLSIHVYIKVDGIRSGHLKRKLHKEKDGSFRLVNEMTQLDERARGRNYTAGLYQRQEEFLRRLSDHQDTRVELHADLAVGRYVWAMHGFGFQKETDRKGMQDRFREFLKLHDITISDEELAWYDEPHKFATFDTGTLVNHQVYSCPQCGRLLLQNPRGKVRCAWWCVGGEQGYEDPTQLTPDRTLQVTLGKKFMLTGKDWYGVRYVNRSNPGDDVADQYRAARIQKKAMEAVSTAIDRFERQADTIAQRFTSGRLRAPVPISPIGRSRPAVQRQPMPGGGGGAGPMPAIRRSSGRSLTPDVRNRMETAFGHDFSQVRIHTDAQADRAARALNARAFTTGQEIFFRQGEYNPTSDEGLGLIAHELTHTVQQGAGPTPGTMRKPAEAVNRSGQLEAQADRMEQFVRAGTGGQTVQIQNFVPVYDFRGTPGPQDWEKLRQIEARVRDILPEYLGGREGVISEVRIRARLDLRHRSVEEAARELARGIAQAVPAARLGKTPAGSIQLKLEGEAFGEPITFSWEKEGGGTRILDFYRPPADKGFGGRPIPSDKDWIRSDAEWKGVGSTSARRQWLLENWKKHRNDPSHPDYEGLARMDSAPKYLKSTLHQEVSAGCWETAHDSYETDFDECLKQARWAQRNLAGGNASRLSGFHFHVAFKRKKEKAADIANLLSLFNDYAALAAFTVTESSRGATKNFCAYGPNLSLDFLGPNDRQQIEQLGQYLAASDMTNLFEQSDRDGARVGDYKFGMAAPRHGLYGDKERIGLEFRAGTNNPDNVRKGVKKLIDYLQNLDTAQIKLGSDSKGQAYSIEELRDAPRFDRKEGLEGLGKLDQNTMLFLIWASENAHWDPRFASDLLTRWVAPFLEWESHPAIKGRFRFDEERQKLVDKLKAIGEEYTTYHKNYSAQKYEWTELDEEDEMKELQGRVQKALAEFHAKARLHDYL